MPLPPEGTRVTRVDDGFRGVVAVIDDELRVVYSDRGSPVMAPKREHWEAEVGPPRRLRAEEMMEIATWADRSLRSLEKHEPMKSWEPIDAHAAPYDVGLRETILTYLRHRG